jgi:alkyldihydroxyacetonephosphate synthase
MQEHPPVELPGASPSTMAWDAWGTAENKRVLSTEVRDLLQSALGISGAPDRSEREVAPVRPTRSRLTDDRRRGFEDIVGAAYVSTDDDVRLRYLGGKSTTDLLARRRGGVQHAPDAVLFPANTQQLESLLRYCSDFAIAVVPFGGGTSVVGGVDPVREWFDTVVTVSTRRLDALTHLDVESRTATLQAGVTGPAAEEMLGRHGLTLGHFPQSFAFASIGGFAATRSSGQSSSGYGRFDDMVEAMTVVTPVGTTVCGRAPASAAGPDLRQIFLGSEGTLGIVTSVTVRVRPIPRHTEYRCWHFPDFASGVEALRELSVATGRPTVVRLSDEAESAIDAALSGRAGPDGEQGGCTVVATFDSPDGDDSAIDAATAADAVVLASGGHVTDAEGARRWEEKRFDSPYLRDALLDAGALAETLETATSWSNLSTVRTRVTTALVEALTGLGTPPIVMCHVSHLYATGASLYFTVVCAAAPDASAQWTTAKRAATEAIVDSGATVTHHHAVGRDHRSWMPDEIGPVGSAVLRAVKGAVDPAGILNPGKLIP